MPVQRHRVEQALADLGLAAAPQASGAVSGSVTGAAVRAALTKTSDPSGLFTLTGGVTLTVRKAGYYIVSWAGDLDLTGGPGTTHWTASIYHNGASAAAFTVFAQAAGPTDNGNQVVSNPILCAGGDTLECYSTVTSGPFNLSACSWKAVFVPTAYYLG